MEQNDKIKIKCPRCGAPMKINREVLNKPGIANQSMKCPICHESSQISQFKIITDVKHERTDDGIDYNMSRQHDNTMKANDYAKTVNIPGKLRHPNGNYVFNLSEGRNIIGRAANSSNATIQLSAGDSRRMSREHLVIDVCKRPNGYIHSVSLYKEGVNKTSINHETLNYGDSVILNDGDMINLPDVSIVFENR